MQNSVSNLIRSALLAIFVLICDFGHADWTYLPFTSVRNPAVATGENVPIVRDSAGNVTVAFWCESTSSAWFRMTVAKYISGSWVYQDVCSATKAYGNDVGSSVDLAKDSSGNIWLAFAYVENVTVALDTMSKSTIQVYKQNVGTSTWVLQSSTSEYWEDFLPSTWFNEPVIRVKVRFARNMGTFNFGKPVLFEHVSSDNLELEGDFNFEKFYYQINPETSMTTATLFLDYKEYDSGGGVLKWQRLYPTPVQTEVPPASDFKVAISGVGDVNPELHALMTEPFLSGRIAMYYKTPVGGATSPLAYDSAPYATTQGYSRYVLTPRPNQKACAVYLDSSSAVRWQLYDGTSWLASNTVANCTGLEPHDAVYPANNLTILLSGAQNRIALNENGVTTNIVSPNTSTFSGNLRLVKELAANAITVGVPSGTAGFRVYVKP